MESDHVGYDDQHYTSRVSGSPFFGNSRAPSGSPQPWELHDVDFLLPDSMSARSYFQDSTRKYCSSLHESEIAFSPELEDTTKPLAFRAGTYWQDMALSEPATSEFSTYLADDVFPDKVPIVSKTPRPTTARSRLAPPAKLRVNATACPHEDFTENCRSTALKDETNVVSPTMLDKKLLVTDNDLRLYSAGSSSAANMRTLRERKSDVKKSSRLERRSKKVKAVPPAVVRSATSAVSLSSSAATRQHVKRHASIGADPDEQKNARPLKRTKSVDASTWSAPSFDHHWYYVRTNGFHGMQPRLLNTMSQPTHPDFSASSFFSPTHYQTFGEFLPFQPQIQQLKRMPKYSAPTRKIGIYSPAERRERLRRFHEKRKLRVYHKRIKYDCRKRLANSCPRVKGRFVRKSELLQAKENDSASPATSESASSTED